MVVKKTKTAKQTRSKPKKRTYDNSARSQKSEETQLRIIQSLVDLLVRRKGGVVQIEEIAKASKISKRTIFRFFKNKEELHQAMDEYLQSYLHAGMATMEERDVAGYAANNFKLFDQNENLVKAYLFSPFGQQARTQLRKKLNQLLFEKLVRDHRLQLNDEVKKRLAIIATLVNARVWYDIREEFGYSGEDMAPALEWALKCLIENI